ncbi:multidrug resistance-associated protein 4-like [Centruroides sculpturatus]|uniref:multidrug resistance-associated protein 4-like n=1 Tax=Centruroides sculpturatus TaxID=218467 RepID=UPI000C6CEC8B|nr:multidrug resistance-associated protein 4-like [Centruroides sculpturatus]
MERKQKNNPFDSAGVFSRAFFCWLFPLLTKGRKRYLKQEDLYETSKYHASEYLGNLLQKEWEKELKQSNPRLLNAILRFLGWQFLIAIIFALIQETVIIASQAYFLGLVINCFDHSSKWNDITAYLSAAGFFGMTAIYLFIYNFNYFVTEVLSLKLKIALYTVLYRKAINLSSSSLAKSNVGQMVNLLANDVSKFCNHIFTVLSIFTNPFLIVVTIVILWQYYKWAIFVGMSLIFLYIPIQFVFGKLYSKLRLQAAILGDKRLNLLNEMIAGMRLIKMYTWELPYAALIEKIRIKEMKKVRMFIYIRGISLILGYPLSRLFSSLIFLAIFLSGGRLTDEIVFVTMNFSIYIYLSTMGLFSLAINIVAEIFISLKRLQDFLLLQGKDNISAKSMQKKQKLMEINGIWMENVQAAWNKETELTLDGISLQVQPGELLTVIGPVGSGKTSLLMSLLGEIPVISGKISVKGKIAYASQEAWIFNGSIRENILFGEEYQEEKYRYIIHITALEKEISLFPKKDLTLVGERGVIMSGGQKARINLARALYLDADIFLFDDPLSAVDVPVAKEIFEKCILEYLKDKICILVTHQIQFLNFATKVLVLNKGRCEAIGNYNELKNSGEYLGITLEKNTSEQNLELPNPNLTFNEEEALYNKQVGTLHDNYDIINNDVKTTYNKTSDKEEQHRILGLSVYKAYMNAGASLPFKILILFMLILPQILLSFSDYWLIKWLQDNKNYNENLQFKNFTSELETINNTASVTYHILELNIYIYLGLVCAVFVGTIISASLLYELFVSASTNLHNKMLGCIIHTPISFLDNNPVGKILNRFSKDVNNMDDMLTFVFYEAIRASGFSIGMIVIEAIICPYLIVITVFLLIAFYVLWTTHNSVLNSIKYLEGKSRSPVFSHLSTSLYGITTIRAFNAETKFISTFNEYQDKHTATWFIYLSLNRWNCLYGQIIGYIYLIITVIVFIVFVNTDDAGSKLGLVMNYGLMISMHFQWIIKQSSETEYQMNSVARILNYSHLKLEAAYESSTDKQPPADWPRTGEIEFQNVSLQYSKDKNIVLNNLTFRIHSGEKIGIVGRTGAGKSSVIAALFRMTEPTGTIIIDGVDVMSIGLRDLRSKLSIIPQDPMLFTGPFRRNIDPFNEYLEEMLWQVIEEVQLKDVIGMLPGGLATHVSEGGRNFSVGQRQLICLARAILRDNKILVMDEATSNMDKDTDCCVQKVIREKFKHCTVLTIAHRLHTIIDSDRVLVLESGKVKEFDTPYTLLKNVNGTFYNLVNNTEQTVIKELYKIARDKYNRKENIVITKL